ncbi:MAG: PorV/PorQ family protein [Ignavibacteriales bacterium]|nr:PorV/PorQ family protein [Ignavibacteriales bacterium]
MKKNYFITAILSLFFLLFINRTFSQSRDFPTFDNLEKVAQTGYQFLKINSGARGAGMGDAFITLEGDASVVFWNPAGLSSLVNHSVFLGYTMWFADIKHQAFSAAMEIGDYGVVGISAVNVDYGKIQGTAISNSSLGYDDTENLNVSEIAIGLSYAKRFSDKFGVGVTVKYCRQDLIARKSSIFAFDIGTNYNTGWNDLKVAVSIQNFSTEIKYIDENFVLPLIYRVGFSVDAFGLANIASEKHKLIIAIEGVNPRDYSERFHIGSEYVFDDTFAIRAGYKFNYDVESFSFGTGFKFKGAQIDYAFSNFGAILGNVNRISLVFNF